MSSLFYSFFCFLGMFARITCVIDDISEEDILNPLTCEVDILMDLVRKIEEEQAIQDQLLREIQSILNGRNRATQALPICIVAPKEKKEEIEFAKNCNEVVLHPTQDTPHMLQIPGSGIDPFFVMCYNAQIPGWVIILWRFSGATNFDRDYESYVYGFGPMGSGNSFWLGLEKIHAMTTFQPHSLHIQLWNNNAYRFIKYSHFVIDGPENDWMLRSLGDVVPVGGKPLPDSLIDHVGNKFSTKDKDFTNENCASQLKGGWWYFERENICYSSSLTGEKLLWRVNGKIEEFTEMSVMIRPATSKDRIRNI